MDRGLGYDESKLAEQRALTSTRALAGKKIGPVRFPTTAANRSPYYLLESEPCG